MIKECQIKTFYILDAHQTSIDAHQNSGDSHHDSDEVKRDGSPAKVESNKPESWTSPMVDTSRWCIVRLTEESVS